MATSKRPADVTKVALALHAQAEGRALARTLADARLAAMVLKGPELQQRLYGTPGAYLSGDLDLLVRPGDAHRARRTLEDAGWELEPGQEVLWWFSAARTYIRNGFRVDLHWGLHAAHLLTWTLRPLERALWRNAIRAESGFFQPDLDALLVYLALHAAGHSYERPQWHANVLACARLADRSRAFAIARRCGLSSVLEASLEPDPIAPSPLILDGPRGIAASSLSWLIRGHFVPRRVRDRIRETLDLWRLGYRSFGRRSWHEVPFAGLSLQVPPGVFDPAAVSERIVDAAISEIDPIQDPVVVDVGTGSGAVAVAIAVRRGDARIAATDISPRAVRAAERNARRYRRGGIRFLVGSLADPLGTAFLGRVDVITTNLPYVPGYPARSKDWGAPLTAIEGPDDDGLGLMRSIATRATELLRPDGAIVFQIGDWQWELFRDDLRELGFEVVEPAARRPGQAIVGIARRMGAR